MTTYWNGQPCKAYRTTAVVAESKRYPLYWARGLVGERRKVVRVEYEGSTFYLDDEDGSGWRKITEGRGSPSYGHRNLEVKGVE